MNDFVIETEDSKLTATEFANIGGWQLQVLTEDKHNDMRYAFADLDVANVRRLRDHLTNTLKSWGEE